MMPPDKATMVSSSRGHVSLPGTKQYTPIKYENEIDALKVQRDTALENLTHSLLM